ncbi:MAG: MBOAT family protein, partial [Armatimonadota bacterium]|nr:MBOAT family protein [Armatimonadota bacterium]
GWNYPLPYLEIILPIGLSFHTIQAMSYTIEVYRGQQKAERHFGIYSLYVMFYPQLVAGPIERPQNLLPQFYEKHEFDYQRVTDGLKLMAWGMFKKTVIADRLAPSVNAVYSDPTAYQGMPLVLATVFFAFQIYCDFSGYSDIARGAAQVMGFNLMVNFKRPYFAKSIDEFWKRWHISLSTWFRDYLYISLGGNRVSPARRNFNLFMTFLVSGLWHGANWTFVVWGALNGLYIMLSLWTKDLRQSFITALRLHRAPGLLKCLQIVTTFSLICFAWIFFRANNLSDAFWIITHLHSGIIAQLTTTTSATLPPEISKVELLIAFCAIAVMESAHLLQRRVSVRHWLAQKPVWFRWGLYYGVAAAILLLGVFNKIQFIYFQF